MENEQIPRGADLTDEDLRVLVDDAYAVKNWAALKMHMKPEQVKDQMLKAMQVRLGRMPFNNDGGDIGEA